MKTSPLICRANHWTAFYVIGISVMKELINWVVQTMWLIIKSIEFRLLACIFLFD